MSRERDLIEKVLGSVGGSSQRDLERMRQEIQNRYAALNLGRSTEMLDALIQNDFSSMRAAAQKAVSEYERLLPTINNLTLPGAEIRQSIEAFLERQTNQTVEDLRRQADLAGINREFIDRRAKEAREDLAELIRQEIEIAEERKLVSREAGWPQVDAGPSPAERASVTSGLFSRAVMDSDLAKTEGSAREHGTPVAFLMVDIDLFKSINDGSGHLAGDRALVSVADCMRAAVGAKGRVYRYGGDEFAALLPNFTAEEGFALAERIRRAVEQVKIEGVAHPLSASLGLSTHPDPARSVEELVKQADDALYASKNRGRNRTTIFEEPLRRG